jgi:hypothetical protein
MNIYKAIGFDGDPNIFLILSQLRHQLWSCRQSWSVLTESWLHTRLDSIDVPFMEEQVAKYHKAVLKMERGLVPNKVVPLLRETVNVWRGERARATIWLYGLSALFTR